MQKVRCDICGKKVTTDRAYRITRYDLIALTENLKPPVQTVCRECLAELVNTDYEEEQ